MTLNLLDLPSELLYCIADFLIIPELNQFARTCKLLNDLIMFESYREREKLIFQLPDTYTEKVFASAQADEWQLLQYYHDRRPENMLFRDFIDSVGLGAAVGGHLHLVKVYMHLAGDNPATILSIAITHKHLHIIKYFCDLNTAFDDDCIRAIVLNGYFWLFCYGLIHNYIVPIRDFPIIALEGIKLEGELRYKAHRMGSLLISTASSNFFQTFVDDFAEDNDVKDYYDVVAFCMSASQYFIEKIIDHGFHDWTIAAAACMKHKNMRGLKYSLDRVDTPEELNVAIKIGVQTDNIYGLHLLLQKYPELHEMILAKCEKYEKRDLLRFLLPPSNGDVPF